MIKKILLSVLSIVGLSLSFSNAQDLLGNVQQIGQTFGSFYNNDYEIQVNGKGNLLTQNFGEGKKLLYFQNGTYFFWSLAEDSKPYMSVSAYNGNYNAGRNQGYVKYYFLCDYIYDGTVANPSNCVRHSIDDGEFPGVAKRLLDSLSNGGYLYYNYYDFIIRSSTSPTYGGLDVCFSSATYSKSLCFYGGLTYSQQYCDTFYNNTLGKSFQNEGSWCSTTASLDNSLSLNYSFDSISQSILGNSPAGAGNGGTVTGGMADGGIELDSEESAINYFEDYYGWDEKICYVGVDNVTDLWGSSVEFKPGSGLDIFDTFESLYGNTELTRMYVWMNAWLINYNQWFQDPEDRLYLANYNSGTNQVDLYYDNLTYPFANQPVALYFMADNISDYTDRQTMASDVVSYCYLKLKGGTFDDIIDNSTKNSINQYTENYNTNKGLNPDGTDKNIDYSDFGSYTSSGQNVSFSGNTSIRNTLEKFFNSFDDLFNSSNSDGLNKILPQWLVSAFLFVVFFKLLRKRK